MTGWDPDSEYLAVAARARRGRACAPILGDAVADAELVVVAAPVGELPRTVREVLDRAPEGCTVTDVGSTKGPVCAAAGDDPRFVGGHPICGAETRGPGRASAELFDGATWFMTPTAATAPERLRLVHGLVTALGARPVAIGPDAHDRLVAVTSHLPHVLANVLLNQAGSDEDRRSRPAARGGRLAPRHDEDRRAPTRGSGSTSSSTTARRSRAALAEQRRQIEQVERALAAGDAGFLARWIGEASGHRRRMLATAFSDPGDLQRLRIHISDRPGVLAGIFQALGAERINVEDFELDHVSAERGGTLTMLVAGEGEARARRASCSSSRATASSRRR